MSQTGQIQINFNANNTTDVTRVSKAFIVGVSQRGPTHRIVEINNVDKYLMVFGQPTNKYEFDFFQAVKMAIKANGIALCYRIPYTNDKNFLGAKSTFYVIGNKNSKINYDLAFLDLATKESNEKKYFLLRTKSNPNNDNQQSLYLFEIALPEHITDYIVLQDKEKYYRVYVKNEKLYINETNDPIDKINAFDAFFVKNETPGDENNYCINIHENSLTAGVGMYLFNSDDNHSDVIYDVMYKNEKFLDVDYSNGAKLEFTLINDFNSALIINDKNTDDNEEINDDITEISAISNCYTGLREDIDPSEILGVFPVFFGSKDAENFRNISYSEIYLLNRGGNYIDTLDTYTCNGHDPYKIETNVVLNELFNEFERSSHFHQKWLEIELAKLIDKYVPQNTHDCSNTLGVAFFAFYLNDEHKLDYTLLESYYGYVGFSDKKFTNLEDLINKKSNFFRLHIDGLIHDDIYIRAMNQKYVLKNGLSWTVPFYAPKSPAPGLQHIIDMDNVFSIKKSSTLQQKLYYNISTLFQNLSRMEFINSAPFDYVLAPGLTDIVLIKAEQDNESFANRNNDIVPYLQYSVNLDNDEISEIDDDDNLQIENIKSIYKLLSFATTLGDKGAIAFLDIPFAYHNYIKNELPECYDISDIKEKTNILLRIIPDLKRSQNLYNNSYPIFNYQYVDKDQRLTRYHKIAKLNRFELVPPSVMMIGAYAQAFYDYDFSPLAGIRSISSFSLCHKSYIDMTIPELFKVLFDLHGVSSFINNKNNGTYPIQETMWSANNSVLKQLHAFRIYIELRRQVVSICRSHLYEPNTIDNIEDMQLSIDYLLDQFKGNSYIDEESYATVWATLKDIEQNQIQVEVVVGIFGAITKIVLNLNLQNSIVEIV